MASSEGQAPKAIIHQRILKAAESQPDATLNNIASEVSGASVDLVERVLDEYGDPAEAANDPKPEEPNDTGGEVTSTTNGDSAPSSALKNWEELPDRIRETLCEVKNQPRATQQEIAERLGVSGATVSNRLSEVDGFEWAERDEFVDMLPNAKINGNGHEPMKQDEAELARPDGEDNETKSLDESKSESLDHQLVHKVIRVCMDSDAFTEEEEIELIARLT